MKRGFEYNLVLQWINCCLEYLPVRVSPKARLRKYMNAYVIALDWSKWFNYLDQIQTKCFWVYQNTYFIVNQRAVLSRGGSTQKYLDNIEGLNHFVKFSLLIILGTRNRMDTCWCRWAAASFLGICDGSRHPRRPEWSYGSHKKKWRQLTSASQSRFVDPAQAC